MEIKGGMHSQIEKYWFIKDVDIISRTINLFTAREHFIINPDEIYV